MVGCADRPEPRADPARNVVLNSMESGLAALESGPIEDAEAAFERALQGIETVYAHDKRAAEARSLWYEEGRKDFKGEPYERAMAYYYRGIAYLKRGDFENARACFKSGVLQDAFAEEDQHRCDFALLIFLEGWASQCLGDRDLSEAAYREVKRLRPDFPLPAADHNVLILAETGSSPRKVSDGVGHYELKFRRGKKVLEKRVRVIAGTKSWDAFPMEDVFWQSATRGGRPIDKILKGQAVYKKTYRKSGLGLTDASSIAAIGAPLFQNAGTVSDVAAALGLVGVSAYAISVKMRPEADTRYWRNLPDLVHMLTLNSEVADQSVRIQFHRAAGDRAGAEIKGMSRSERIEPIRGRFGLVWTRSRSATVSP